MSDVSNPMIDGAALASWAGRVLASQGLPERDAVTVADALVDADLRGVETHGVGLLPGYLDLLRRGVTKASPDIKIEGGESLLRVDGDCGLGQVVTTRALAAARDAAARHGAAMAAISRTGHLGALGYFTRLAAEGGMIAILMQNGPPLMGLPGSRARAIGNNPIAFSAPVAGRPAIVFDVATSEAAYGKIIRARAKGEPIPEGWALDAEGRPTRDAGAAASGILLPSGGPKGIGLAMMVEVLAGSLTGTRPVWGGNIFGAFLMVIDPRAAAGADAYREDIEAWLAHYAGSGDEARYPGERAAATLAQRTRDGIPLTAELHATLARIGDEAGVPLPDSA